MRLRHLLLALLLVPALSQAQTKPPLLAVLEFDSPDQSASIDDLQLLTDAFRSAVVKETGARFKVLTRDSMQEMVPAEQMRCFAGMCAAEIGRKLQAQYVLAGSVRKLGPRRILTLEGYESNGGRVLGTEQLKGADSGALLDEIEKQARGLVRTWLSLSAAPVVASAPVASQQLGGGSTDFDFGGGEDVVTTFETEPTGAIVLLDGQLLCPQTPCSKPVSSGSHSLLLTMEGYDSVSQQVEVSASKKRFSTKLPPNFALLSVITTPLGLPVTLDGKPLGTSPISDKRIDARAHDVMVVDPCYGDVGERFSVAKAERKTVRLEAQPRWAGLKVSAEDEAGNALEAEIEVDGQPMGTTPKNVKVPMCSKEIVVKAAGGKTFKQALSLKEKEVATIAAKPKQGCPAGMVFIPGGTFDMGSNDGDSDEKPVHRVTVSAFCIDRTEHAESDGMPTVNVDWDTAKATCEREGKRLPTAAEWEFAARGTQGRKYPWGNSEPSCDKANYSGCGGSTKRVGSAPAGATPEGVQDLAGNVWEWVADCYGSYPSSPQNNPGIKQNACQQNRVFRGGGYISDASHVRASSGSGSIRGTGASTSASVARAGRRASVLYLIYHLPSREAEASGPARLGRACVRSAPFSTRERSEARGYS